LSDASTQRIALSIANEENGMKRFITLLAVGAAALGSIQAQEPTPAITIHPSDLGLFRGFQGDPADSLYRVAHDLLARGEYGRSAQLFKEIGEKFPKSRYQDELPYNEAFARYRIGSTTQLEIAARLLEPRAKKLLGVVAASDSPGEDRGISRNRGRTSDGDVVGLYLRINGVLAQRGNSDAATIVKNAPQPNASSCDGDDMVFKREAMGALSRMDPPQAMPIIKRVLNKPDACNIELRRSAVFMLGRAGDTEAGTILVSAVKSDPSPTVRVEAIPWLPKLMGDAGVSVLEDVLRTEQDERIQRAVVRTLAASDNARARKAMRALIERKDAALTLRTAAVSGITSERATSEDVAYLRDIYPRVDNDDLKQAIVGAVSRFGSHETDEWILSIAKNPNEPSSVRSDAIARVIRLGTIADWAALYDAAQSLDVRSRIVSALESRRETEAADKLVEIAKTSTVPSLRTRALKSLMNRKDPRVPQLIDEIMNGRRP
jgi:HEAT repeat protein